MKNYLWAPIAALSLSACIHDEVTRESPPEPARRFAPISARKEITRPEGATGRYEANRVYLITRLETVNQSRGEWRAVGSSIQQEGSRIRFVEMGSGRLVEFAAPHQITPMASRQDQRLGPEGADPSTIAGNPGGAVPSSASSVYSQ